MSRCNFDSSFFRKVITKCDKIQRVNGLSEIVRQAVEVFFDEFDYYPDIAAYAPGVFTILGDHLEYVNGFLVQGALPVITVVVGKSMDSIKCKIVTTAKDPQEMRKAVFPIYDQKENVKVFPQWVTFIKGIIKYFPHKNLKGFDAVIHSNVPVDQGYGSSAALQVAFYTFLESTVKCMGEKMAEKSKLQKGKICRIAETQSQPCSMRLGQWDNLTSFVAEQNRVVSINCRASEVSLQDMKDLNILFLLIYPNMGIEIRDRELVQIRNMQLLLAAKFLGLKHIIDVTEYHLEVLKKMEDPSKEAVKQILREYGFPENSIFNCINDLFFTPKLEINDDKEEWNIEKKSDVLYPEEMLGEDKKEMEEMPRPNSVPCGAQEKQEKRSYKGPAAPSPMSYIHQMINKMCQGREPEIKIPERICEEVNRQCGIDILSVSSESPTVMWKLSKRVRHIVTEKKRCSALPNVLNRLDYEELGSMIIQSHLSLKLDFEVSCDTLDNLFQLAIETERVYGAKMTSGGGALVLLHRNTVNELVDKVIQKYGRNFQFYLVFPSGGAGTMDLGVEKNPMSVLSSPYINLTDLRNKAVENFIATYRYKPTHAAYAPAVMNLVGDHTDFNHGFAISFALNMLTLVVGAFNGTDKVRASTTSPVNEPNKIIFILPTVKSISPGKIEWAKYIKGVIMHFKGNLKGFDCLIETNLASGLGLGKSALITAFYTFLEELSGEKTGSSEKAYRCMQAEQEFSNVLSGIGKYAVAIKAKENYAVHYDFRTNIGTPIPFLDPSIVIVIVFKKPTTKLNRNLLFTRVGECYEVAWAYGAKTLRCLTKADLKAKPHQKVKKIYLKRAMHILEENERVLRASEALKNNDFEALGEILVESHISLRDQYEVSNEDLDYLVSHAMEVDGVLGSKIPCSGYLNCTFSLVKRWAVDDLIEYLMNDFPEPLSFYVVKPSRGCGSISLKDYIDSFDHPELVFENVFNV